MKLVTLTLIPFFIKRYSREGLYMVNKNKCTYIYPIEGRVRLSGGALCPNTGVTCPDIELLPKLTLVLPRLLPPIFLVKFKFAIAI